MREHLPSLSAAANAAALVVVVLVAAVLVRSSDTDVDSAGAVLTSPPGAAGGPRARLVVLVVVDGLRADIAGDAGLMPFTRDMGLRGAVTTAEVEALVPSTIAGVTTLATGAVPSPAAFVHDFGAPPAERGGLFEAIARDGGRSVVAGPALWSDLFGRWTDTAHAAPALGASDDAVLRAGLARLDGPAYRLAVFHFSTTDEAAHLHGAWSTEYTRAVAWCDDAVRQIAERLGPDAAIVVTADHGVTDRGGHAGPEPEVLNTPMICFGPGFARGRLPPLRQRDVPRLIAAALGLDLPPPVVAASSWAGLPRAAGSALLIAAALLFAVRLWSALVGGAGGRPHAFWLNGTVWVALGLLTLGQPAAAAVLCVAALAVRVVNFSRAARSTSTPLAPAAARRPHATWLALGVGGAWALLRIAAEWQYGATPFEIPGAGLPLAVAVGLGTSALIGVLLRRALAGTQDATRRTPGRTDWAALWAGGALAVAAAPVYALAGQTLSLSSIGVGEAYRVAVHGGGVAGILAAVGVVMVLQALPPLALVVGCVLPQRRLTARDAGAFSVGISAVPAGEALAAATVLLVADGVRLNALSLGCLLRAAATLVFLTCGTALIAVARGRDRRERPTATAGGAEPDALTRPPRARGLGPKLRPSR